MIKQCVPLDTFVRPACGKSACYDTRETKSCDSVALDSPGTNQICCGMSGSLTHVMTKSYCDVSVL